MQESISLISTESKAVTPSGNDLVHYLTIFLHAVPQMLHLIMQWQQHPKESTHKLFLQHAVLLLEIMDKVIKILVGSAINIRERLQ